MLCADDTVTAALSCLDSFHYLGISGEILGMQADLLCTLGAIAAMSAVNWFGPRGMGRIALVVALITVVFTAIIAVCAIPSLHHTRVELPVHDSSIARAWSDAWIGFTEIVLALSGVEAIANMTGIMVSPVRVTVRRKHPDRHVCNPFSRLLKCRRVILRRMSAKCMGTVATVWIYPVKSMMGEELNGSQVTTRGLLGDRAHALVDQETGKVVSAKNPNKWPELFAYRAAYTKPATEGALPPVSIALPDGRLLRSDAADINDQLSKSLARSVMLKQSATEKAFFRAVLA